MVMSTVRESGYSVPVGMAEEDMQSASEEDEFDDSPPVHPVPTMQGAFEESMSETMNEEEPDVPDRYSKADSVTRRKMLLEQEQYERTVAGRWKQKAGEKFHPLWKLVAQISFGMHLLQQGLAKSDEEVLKILQTHVDEVDGFLERTTEDFDLAQGDINERIRYLKLPLEHGAVFDQMLQDRPFRVAIVEGNEKIEHIIDRTAAAMNDALKDVQKGLDATRELAKYMTRIDKQWEDRTEDNDSVYLAMIGNTEGWTRAFLTLQSKGGHLRKALVQLGTIVAEMQKRAGAASRKNLVPARSVNDRYNVETRAASPQHSATPPRSPMKPLPTAPESAATRVATTQRFVKTRASRSTLSSPVTDNSMSRADTVKAESSKNVGSVAKSPNPSRLNQSPEPSRVKSPTPDISHQPRDRHHFAKSPKIEALSRSPEPHRNLKSPEPARSLRSPEPARSVRSPISPRKIASPEPDRSQMSPTPSETAQQTSRSKSPEMSITFKSPQEIMAKMKEENNWSPGLVRSESRRKSFMERTQSLLRRRPSFQAESEASRSPTSLPIQSPSSPGSPGKSPADSPGILRRLSSSRKTRTMSMSNYSASPTSLYRPGSGPVLRETSPELTRNGLPVPTQSSYGTLTLLPILQQISPLQTPFITDFKSDPAPEIPPPIPEVPPEETPDSIEILPASTVEESTLLNTFGENPNASHPLLREARHARFAPGSTPGTHTPSDLPLRHYQSQPSLAHSNPDLSQRELEPMIPPKRTSSLVYSSQNESSTLLSEPKVDLSRRSPTPNQGAPTASDFNSFAQARVMPSAEELGIHPAHRTPDPYSASTVAPSPAPSASESTTSDPHQTGSTPPPIATRRSPPSESSTMKPPSRFAPNAPRLHIQSPSSIRNSNSPPTQTTSPSKAAESAVSSATTAKPPVASSPTSETPFYLNPASSSDLKDFLASTPPPSPPPMANRTEPGTPASTNTAHFFNRNFLTTKTSRPGDPSSPPPPAAGSAAGSENRFQPWQRAFTTGSSTNLAEPKMKKGLGLSMGSVRVKENNKNEGKSGGWKKVFGGGRNKSINGLASASTSNLDVSSMDGGLGISNAAPKKERKFGNFGRAPGQGIMSGLNGYSYGAKNNNKPRMVVGGGGGAYGINPVGGGGMSNGAASGASGESGAGTSGSEEGAGFVGVGPDGVWISRKNFVRS